MKPSVNSADGMPITFNKNKLKKHTNKNMKTSPIPLEKIITNK